MWNSMEVGAEVRTGSRVHRSPSSGTTGFALFEGPSLPPPGTCGRLRFILSDGFEGGGAIPIGATVLPRRREKKSSKAFKLQQNV